MRLVTGKTKLSDALKSSNNVLMVMKQKKTCVAEFLQCLIGKEGEEAVAYAGQWKDKAVECPHEFKACVESGVAKSTCVARFLNCLMAKEDESYAIGDWKDKAVRCPKEFKVCVDGGETKKTCVAEFLKCLIGKEEGEAVSFGTDYCMKCEQFAGTIRMLMKTPQAQQYIISSMISLCAVAPNSVSGMCTELVNSSGQQTIDIVIGYLKDPSKLR